MENSVDALKIAFAVFIFIFALSLAFSTITKAKQAADVVLFVNDETNYQDEISEEDREKLSEKGRFVNIDTVISTLYRCKNETMVVKVVDTSGNLLKFNLYGTNDGEAIFDSAEDQGELSFKIRAFVKKYIDSGEYLEQFVEAKYSGKEITAEDGSSIIVTKGGSKMYITYTKQP